MAAFSINSSTGALIALAGSPFPTGSGAFSVAVDRSGKYLYTANSFDNSVSGFTINLVTGALNPVSGSPFPTRALGGFPFAIATDPAGKLLYTANQGSNNISGFKINQRTEALTPVAGSPFSGIFNPYDLAIVKVP